MIKALFLGMMCLLVRAQTLAQYTNQAREFTDWIFAGLRHKGKKILVTERIGAATFSYLKETLSADSFQKRTTFDQGKTIQIEKFIISKEERRIIDSFFTSPANLYWSAPLNNATILDYDSVISINNSGTDIGNYLSVKYGSRTVFSLTKPIFLRNNTYCIFYDESACGILCGEGTLAIYRKEDDQWDKYIILAHWVN